MSAIWFQNTDVSRLLRAGTLDTEWTVDELARVKEAVLPGSGPISLQIDIDKVDGIVTLDGTLKGVMRVTCQRCLEAMSVAVDGELKIAVLRNAAKSALAPAGFEPVVIEQGLVCVSDLVEDEVLLKIPFAARHADGECGPLAKRVAGLQPESGDADMTTPFAKLGQLLHDDH